MAFDGREKRPGAVPGVSRLLHLILTLGTEAGLALFEREKAAGVVPPDKR
jgi:hypothetical protein